MVRVVILPVGPHQHARLLAADHLHQPRAVLDGALHEAVRQVQIQSHVQPQNSRGAGAFLVAQRRVAAAAQLAAGQVHHSDAGAGGLATQQQAGAAQLGIVGMGAHRQYINSHVGAIVSEGPLDLDSFPDFTVSRSMFLP